MSVSGIHQGTLRMYGGFIFKQWKKRFLLLTAEGGLFVCHHVSAPPDQLVLLQNSCEAIVEGKEILDLPKIPAGGSRDCCFALILTQNKYLLLMADTPADCSQWLNVLKKVKQSVSSPLSLCKRHQVPPLNIALKDLVPDQIQDKDPPTPPISNGEALSPGPLIGSPKDKGRDSPRTKYYKEGRPSVGCLRHGTINNTQTVRAVYLLMGGAAASSAMGYLGSCSPSGLDAKAPDLPLSADFSDVGPAGAYHTDSPAITSPHFNSFDFEMADADFNAFDCGGFTF
ncbi:uncharacterized protein LOC133650877 isoform X1 [Entelurus aequoreus]|uniref:uncharacterized protein LOC133650861 isoform X1 n=1 Tax=Entelurus aequoreus TaxID=161455 RepID=UPI002B1E8D4A|nr:uncharacterized protein LOC133650861 isoform X1 [Entelurus aequoreus]XP_061904591.1 uncharacterized protein LOC133650877 isoform X1 [Entelurus aequoreus]